VTEDLVVDLFAGPGGWDEGARIAGYKGRLVGIEHDWSACKTAMFTEETRRVTVQEAAVLQSFRPDYPWFGTKSQQYQAVGNAVPPLLAAAILRPLFQNEARQEAA
jgi:site-specific DNA-cytosine methylase